MAGRLGEGSVLEAKGRRREWPTVCSAALLSKVSMSHGHWIKPCGGPIGYCSDPVRGG